MLVIGNGESRSLVDVDSVAYKKVGCNAIHRDFKVEHLVCVDKPMLREILNSSYHKHAKIYTRRDWFVHHRLEENIRMVPDLPYVGTQRPDDPVHWGSGPYAVLLAAKLCTARTVRLLGFDLYGTDNKVNNVYKDTANYAGSSKNAVDPRYWIYQIGRVFEHFDAVDFVIHQTDDWKLPAAWKQSNVTVDTISNL